MDVIVIFVGIGCFIAGFMCALSTMDLMKLIKEHREKKVK